MEYKLLVGTILVIGFVYCQDDLPDLSAINTIPGLESIDQNDLPQKEDVDKFFKTKCEANGGDYAALEAAKDNVKSCFEQHMNITLVMEKVEEAKKTGSMDEVFGKYCKKKSLFMGCMTDITNEMEKCLQENERDHMKIIMNTTDSLVDFICFKDGDRLAMFVAEGGFECLESRKDGIQSCINKTLSGKIPSDLSMTNLPLLLIGEDECRDLDKLQTCVVEELEQCSDNTPANLAEALFKFIKKVPVCQGMKSSGGGGGAAANTPEASRKFKRMAGDQYDTGITAVIQHKCKSHAGYTEEFVKQVYSKFETCYNLSVFERDANLIGPCTYLEPPVLQCVNTFVDDVKSCFAQDEAYMNVFIKSAINGSLHYICDNNMANYRHFFQSQQSECLMQQDNSIFTECVSSNTVKTNINGEIVWTKPNLCEKLSNVDKCVQGFITMHCNNDKGLIEFTKGVLSALSEQCSNELTKSGSSTLIFNSALLLGAFYHFMRYFY